MEISARLRQLMKEARPDYKFDNDTDPDEAYELGFTDAVLNLYHMHPELKDKLMETKETENVTKPINK